MKLGAHCVLYGAEIASNTSSVLRRLKNAGAEGCELGERFFGTEDVDRLQNALTENNMALAGIHAGSLYLTDLLHDPDKCFANLETLARFVCNFNCRSIIATGRVDASPSIDPCTLDQGAPIPELHNPACVLELARNLDTIAKKIQDDYGIRIHYHNHSWEFCDDGLIWFTLADHSPNIDFALDTGWAAVTGFDPVDLLDRYPGRFHYVHLRDYRKVADPGSQIYADVHTGFVDLGKGDMGYPRLMRKLNQVLAPDDWAVVEYELGNFDESSYLQALSYLKGIRDML